MLPLALLVLARAGVRIYRPCAGLWLYSAVPPQAALGVLGYALAAQPRGNAPMPVKLTAATLAKGFPLKAAGKALSALVQGLAARLEAEAQEAAERDAMRAWNDDPLDLRNRRERLERQAAEYTWDRAPAPSPAPKPRRAPRRRSVFGRSYTVVGSYHAKYGTWTKYMVDVIRGHANTADADRTLRQAQFEHGRYPNKKLDWTWAEKVGLIRFD